MKRIDYVIFGGLVISLVLFLYLTSISTSVQNTTVIENQKLIRQSLNETQQNAHIARDSAEVAKNNSELILENQQAILNLSHGLSFHGNITREELSFLRNTFDEAFFRSVLDHENNTRQVLQKIFQLSNETSQQTDSLIGVINALNATINVQRNIVELLSDYVITPPPDEPYGSNMTSDSSISNNESSL